MIRRTVVGRPERSTIHISCFFYLSQVMIEERQRFIFLRLPPQTEKIVSVYVAFSVCGGWKTPRCTSWQQTWNARKSQTSIFFLRHLAILFCTTMNEYDNIYRFRDRKLVGIIYCTIRLFDTLSDLLRHVRHLIIEVRFLLGDCWSSCIVSPW